MRYSIFGGRRSDCRSFFCHAIYCFLITTSDEYVAPRYYVEILQNRVREHIIGIVETTSHQGHCFLDSQRFTEDISSPERPRLSRPCSREKSFPCLTLQQFRPIYLARFYTMRDRGLCLPIMPFWGTAIASIPLPRVHASEIRRSLP